MKLLKVSTCTIGLLLFSWNFTPTRALWDLIDAQVFYWLNPLIFLSPKLLKACNSTLFDWFTDLVILSFMIPYFLQKTDKTRPQKIAEFLFITIIAALTIALINKKLLPDFFEIKRVSPSLQLSPSYRLSSLFPGAKDSSHSCFPGDHATTACFFLFSYWRFTSFRKALPVFFYGVFMALPRLITGAHWFTDVIMGSFCIALSSFTIAFGTSLHAYCVPVIQQWLEGIPKLYGRLIRTFQ